jgi:hypothetical protein
MSAKCPSLNNDNYLSDSSRNGVSWKKILPIGLEIQKGEQMPF